MAIESTEHYGSEERLAIQEDLVHLEDLNSSTNEGFRAQEDKLKTEVANLETLLRRLSTRKKTHDQERLSIAAMKRLIER